MKKLAISLAVAASAILVTAASAAPLSNGLSIVPENGVESVRLICDQSGRCIRTRGGPRVVIQRKQGAKPDDPQSILAVVFLFAKKDASGQPAIGAQEKNLEFVCESGLATLRTSFDLQKMAGAQGPDW